MCPPPPSFFLVSVSEQMQTRDAMMFPLIGSVVLFSLYLVFLYLPAFYVNLVLKAYFFLFGLIVLGQKFSTIFAQTLPSKIVSVLTIRSLYIPDPTTFIWKTDKKVDVPA